LPEESLAWQEIGRGLEEDHLARLVERQVNQLDPAAIHRTYRGCGSTPYDPVPLLKMVLYQYLKGNQSPAAWLEEAKRNQAMQWLGRGYTPARRTWYEFRDRAGYFLESLHAQLIGRALDAGVLDPSVGAQDGTTIAASASRHRMVNQATLQKRSAQLAQVLAGTFEEKLPGWIPPTERGRQDLAERMAEATHVLEERIAQNAKKPSDKRKDPANIKVSLSEPIAPLGRDKLKVFRPLYTVQYVIAPHSHLILAYGCEAQATDAGTLAPMIDRTQSAVRGRLRTMLADSAYCSILDLQACLDRSVELLAPVQENTFTAAKRSRPGAVQIPREEFTWDEAQNVYRCPAGHLLNYIDRARKQRAGGHTLWESRYRCDPMHCGACPLATSCLRPGARARTIKRLEGQELLDAQRAKMALPENQARYKLRGQTVERGFADTKGNRRLTRFHGRGLSRARAETGLLVLAQNILRLDHLERAAQNSAKPPT
jgi:transposase